MDQATQDEITAVFNEAETALNSDDVETMNTAKTNVDNASMKIGQAIYNQTPTDQGEQTENTEENTENQEENAEEGENTENAENKDNKN